jgi:hypothetical protein
MAQSGSTVTLKNRKTKKNNGKLRQYKEQINLKIILQKSTLLCFFLNKHYGIKLRRHKSACKPPAV